MLHTRRQAFSVEPHFCAPDCARLCKASGTGRLDASGPSCQLRRSAMKLLHQLHESCTVEPRLFQQSVCKLRMRHLTAGVTVHLEGGSVAQSLPSAIEVLHQLREGCSVEPRSPAAVRPGLRMRHCADKPLLRQAIIVNRTSNGLRQKSAHEQLVNSRAHGWLIARLRHG